MDYELDYARKFMDYLNRNSSYNFETRVFTNVSSLEVYTTRNIIDILLIGEGVLYDNSNNKVKNTITLSEGQRVKEDNSNQVVYKYQAVEKVMKEVLACCAIQEEVIPSLRYSEQEGSTKILGVFSPWGGSIKTFLALALGQAYAKDKKTLYINFELFGGICFGCSNTEDIGMSDLIYYIKQKKTNLAILLEAMSRKMGDLNYISPVQHYSDLFSIDQEDIKQLIGELKCNSNYEVVIIELDFLNDISLDLLGCCEKVYLPKYEDVLTKAKEAAFYHMLKLEEREDICKNFIPIDIPLDISMNQGGYDMERLCVGEMGKLVLEAMV